MKYPKCSQCDAEIRPGGRYSVICREIYCSACEKEYLHDEIESRFDELQEQLEEAAGIPVYYMEGRGS